MANTMNNDCKISKPFTFTSSNNWFATGFKPAQNTKLIGSITTATVLDTAVIEIDKAVLPPER